MWLKIGNKYKHLSDTELVQEYRHNGDLQSLGILYERHMEKVYGVCLRYFKNDEDSKDAVMQIFEKLITRLRTHQVDNFRSWLYVLTKNHCLTVLRKRNRSLTLESDPVFMHSMNFVHPDIEPENGEVEKKELAACMESLKDIQKKCLHLFYYEGKSYVEIAEMLDKKKEKIRSYLQNGRRNLKICMENKNAKKSRSDI